MGNRKPKDIFSYPRAIFEIVERVAVRGEAPMFTAPNLAEARKMRGKFYAFRQALERAVFVGLDQPKAAEGMQVSNLQDTLQFARGTVCWFDEGAAKKRPHDPVRVTYMSKDVTPEAQYYAAALAGVAPEQQPSRQETDDERTARELAELVSEKEKADKDLY